jgi:diguanylate cyclase (GGDEF)-like protein/PAS domain S-box-containing protein
VALTEVSDAVGAMLDRATAAAGIGAWRCDLASDTLTWSSGTYLLFGLATERALDRRSIVAMYDPESREKIEYARARAIARREAFTLEAKIAQPDGRERWIRIRGDVICDAGRPVQIYGVKQDVTEERHQREALRRLAEQDPVTGLASRAMFQARFLACGCGSEALAPVGALVMFDLDGFKTLNDLYGHAAGDACLREVAVRLTAGFSDALMVARIGGDEFAVLVPPGPASETLYARISGVIAQICQPVFWQGYMLRVGVSAGAAVTADAWQHDPKELFSVADAALYGAKRQGRNRVVVAGGAVSLAFPQGAMRRAVP